MECVKVPFSKEKVGKALRKIMNRGKAMRAYKCDKCFKYHVTSSLKGEIMLGMRRKQK